MTLGKTREDSFLWCAMKRLCKDKLALAGLIIVVLFLIVGFAAPLLAPHDPTAVNTAIRLQMPSWEYPLGTDQLGRCMLSRLIYGTQTTLVNALAVLGGILAVGVPLGIIAGYKGGWIDNLIMRAADIVCTFPSSLLALAVVSILGPSLLNIMIVLVCLWWAPFARIMRSTVLKVKEKDYVMAAQAAGSSKLKIMVQHILLNSISPIVVYSTLRVGMIIMHIAGFSFIGLGTQPPQADWGVMLSDSREFITTAPLMMVWPGLAIMLSVFSLNMLGEGLNQALMPGSSKKARRLGDGE
ncbi:MAG: ABC transporter permease subunit [Oscillospiraceae bacterium]|nr:ABC transporter permease subunit [Oscillospiraceae bacterium]